MNKFAIEKRKIGKKTKKNRLDVRNNFNFEFNCTHFFFFIRTSKNRLSLKCS